MADSFLDSINYQNQRIIQFDDILDRGLPGLPGRKPPPVIQNRPPSIKGTILGLRTSKKNSIKGLSPILQSINSKSEITRESKESFASRIQESIRELNIPNFNNVNITKGLPSVRAVDRDTNEIVAIPPDNFEKDGSFVLTGGYEENKITFDKFSLTDLTITNQAKFEFILKVVGGGTTKWFVSDVTYARLKEEEANNKPFYSHELLKPSSIVTLDLRPIIDNLKLYKPIEEEAGVGVRVDKNLFYGPSTDGIDYDALLRYVDFLVSKPSSNYDERILPVASIGQWTLNERTTVTIPPSANTPVKSVTIEQSKPAIVKDKKTNTTSSVKPTPPKPKIDPPKPQPLKPEDTLLGPTIEESKKNPTKIYPVSSTVNIKNGKIEESFYNPSSGVPFVNLPQIKIDPNRFNSNGSINFTKQEQDNLAKSIADSLKNLPPLDFSNIDLSKFTGG